MYYYLAVLSVVLGAMGVGILFNRMRMLFKAERVMGTLTGWYQTDRVNGSRPLWYRKISFVASSGRTYEVLTGMGTSSKPAGEVGDLYPLRYDPAYPEKALIFTPLQYWSAPPVFFVMSGICAFAFLKNLHHHH